MSVDYNAHGMVFDNVDDVPAHEYGLLLGTSPTTPQGAYNFYFDKARRIPVRTLKNSVQITEAGRNIMPKALEIAMNASDKAISGLSAKALERLMMQLDTITSNLKSEQ